MFRRTPPARWVFPLVIVLGGVALAAAEGDREVARRALAALSAAPSASALTERPATAARKALDRAEDARAANDPEHAARLEAVALEWATTGTDLVRAAAVESKAEAAQQRAAELETKSRRARALLEQTIARRGRAEAQLQALGAGAAPSGSPAAAGLPATPASSAPRGVAR